MKKKKYPIPMPPLVTPVREPYETSHGTLNLALKSEDAHVTNRITCFHEGTADGFTLLTYGNSRNGKTYGISGAIERDGQSFQLPYEVALQLEIALSSSDTCKSFETTAVFANGGDVWKAGFVRS